MDTYRNSFFADVICPPLAAGLVILVAVVASVPIHMFAAKLGHLSVTNQTALVESPVVNVYRSVTTGKIVGVETENDGYVTEQGRVEEILARRGYRVTCFAP